MKFVFSFFALMSVTTVAFAEGFTEKYEGLPSVTIASPHYVQPLSGTDWGFVGLECRLRLKAKQDDLERRGVTIVAVESCQILKDQMYGRIYFVK